jgi:signal transduction histidine kinase/CheY-like chemotaxis protein/HPt (histidine-containing phosphotransfer) domain-containing protein
MGAGLHRRAPATLGALLALTALVSAGRLVLILRFDELYDRSPRLWQAGFFGGLLALSATLGGLLSVLILTQGVTSSSQFALAVVMGIGVMAIVVYSHSLAVVWAYILLLGLPSGVALALVREVPLWIPVLLAVGILYMLGAARQQHQERWQNLAARHELARSRDELEEIVKARVDLDVTERRRTEGLRLAKEAAERTAQAKAQFLANMSHEIRTPMAGVVGLTDLLLTTGLDSQQSEYARLIQSSAVSLLRVIDDILDFSKIDAGKLTFEEIPFDLLAVLHEVVDLLRLAAVAKGTALELEVAPELPGWVKGDPGRLRQVLMNLVGNAVKFTDGGSVNVDARMAPDGRVHVRVRDTGIGIPVAAQGRLFELFSQADGSTSRRFGGTGLGLAITRRIVEGMGGEIGFESALGVGSIFWITVGLERTEPPAAPASPAGRPVRLRRILTAEDNAINQLVITEQLKALGYDVTAASNGLEALEALRAGAFDLVLMDCQMPHLDGYEATQRIRQLPGEQGQIPIVALTAHAIKEDLDKCLAVGMNDTITKPFNAEVLRRKLDRWLGTGPADGDRRVEAELPFGEGAGEALDSRHLERLRSISLESDPDLMTKIVEQFRSQQYVEELRGALDRGDRVFLQARAHGLKGTSSLLGATRLPRLCARLEALAATATREECLRQLALIESEHHRVLDGLASAFGSG